MVENHLVGVLSYFRKLLERMGLACRKGSGPPSSSVAIYFYCCRLFSSCSTLRHSFSCHFPPCLNSQACAHLWCHDARARGANLSCTRWSSKSAVMLSRSMKSCEAFENMGKLKLTWFWQDFSEVSLFHKLTQNHKIRKIRETLFTF